MIIQKLDKVIKTTKNHLQKLETLGITTIEDFILYFPRTYNDTSEFTPISEIEGGKTATIKAKIANLVNIKSRFGKSIIKALLTDSSGSIEAVWFNQPHLFKLLPRNQEMIFSGKAKVAMGKLSLQAPTHEVIKKFSEQIHSGRIVPVYHETEGINSKWIREKLKPLIDSHYKQFLEFLPEEIITTNALTSYPRAIKNIHFPKNEEELNEARNRLAFNELFLLQLKLVKKKWDWKQVEEKNNKVIQIHEEAVAETMSRLPFDLTNAQQRVLQEINDDLQKTLPMTRLVQGDVGSGKTIVAALTSLNAVKNGYQVAVMAPTEILAKQHYSTFLKTLGHYSLNIQFISGSTPKSQKEDIVRQMQTGTADIIIGTHSLIQENIGFKNLGLAIIDEQHRFGVKQREKLKSHGTPHLLSMTATPIPRTLAITIYGDYDLSIIDEMPKGRQEIITRVVPENKRTQAYRWIEDQIQKGRQAFIICPLIDESDVLEVKSVIKEYEFLSQDIFPNLKLGLMHGKLKQEEKDKIMQDFKDNKTNILVSTSVIEVGIDIPNATIMLIEGAERFGLSQLHQFRGRVGRGEHQSYCFLFTGPLSQEGQIRMKAMEKHSSGFKLSEIDLELRGPGEIYGVRQSGIPDLKVASLTDFETVDKARKAAESIIEKDPHLKDHPELKVRIEAGEDLYIGD